MNILVTGATGFIGRHLVEELSKSHANIFCLVRKASNTKILEPYGVKFIYADITEFDSLFKNINEKIDVIFHCAGYVLNDNIDALHKVNVRGTENICRLALKLAVERVIYLSSVSVVSGNPHIPLVEDLPFVATNIYAESKIEAEKVVLEYRKKGLEVVILRPCMVYGEDEPHLLKRMLHLLKYRLLPLVNKGESKFHLVYVKNVVDAMIFSLRNDEFLKGTFFVADRDVLTTKEVMNIMASAISARPPYEISRRFTPFLLAFPYAGRRLKFFLKDRVYSQEKITATGFRHSYPIKESLATSCRCLFNSKKARLNIKI
ncbi:MAG: NAD(P)-dependent oxidoreductase [Candidatus Omnitrophica bacterium]|nr:NAD(P)-dependent oxidoreductase [Candidatus Omnitrophota bacterium]